MALVAQGAKAPEYPIGTHAAVCVDVIDAGFFPPGPKSKDQTQPVQKTKLRFYYEAQNEAGEWAGYYVDWFGTLSLGTKSMLSKFLEPWRGKPFTDEERRGFDIERFEGCPAFISVAPREGSEYVDVAAALPVPRGFEVPAIPHDYVKDRDREEPMAVKHSYEKCLAKMRGTAPARTTATPQTRQHPVDSRPVQTRGVQVPNDYADGDPLPARPVDANARQAAAARAAAARAALVEDDGGSMHPPAPRPPARAVAQEQGRQTMRAAAIQQQRPAQHPDFADFPGALEDPDDDLPF